MFHKLAQAGPEAFLQHHDVLRHFNLDWLAPVLRRK